MRPPWTVYRAWFHAVHIGSIVAINRAEKISFPTHCYETVGGLRQRATLSQAIRYLVGANGLHVRQAGGGWEVCPPGQQEKGRLFRSARWLPPYRRVTYRPFGSSGQAYHL